MSQTKAQLISDLVQALNFTGTSSAPANGVFLSAANTLSFATNSAQRLTINSGGTTIFEGAVNIPGKIFHAGDTDTAFGFPATDTVSIETGGSEALRVTNSGDVGIGTSSPVGRLHVHNSGTGSGDHAYAFFTTGDTGATASDGLTIGVAATQLATINYREAGALSLSTSSTERMRITANGKIGIGTSNPGEELTIASATPAVKLEDTDQANSYIQLSAANGDMFLSANGASSQGQFILRSGNNGSFAERMRIDSSGNVGIGTASPQEALHISGGNIRLTQPAGTEAKIVINEGTTTNGIELKQTATESLLRTIASQPFNIRAQAGSGSTSYLAFWTRDNERMRISATGKVGIGTTSPTGVLEIDATSTTDMIMLDVGGTNFARLGHNSSGGSPLLDVRSEGHFRILTNGNNERFRISSDGKVGIGTSSPQTHLVIRAGNPQFTLEPTANTQTCRLQFCTTDGTIKTSIQGGGSLDTALRVVQNSVETARISTSGKVGFGTNSPDGSHRTTIQEGTSGHGVLVLDRTSNIDGTFRSFVSIRRSGTVVGSIKVNNSATQYNTSSDHRLKENVVTMSNAIDRLKQLQPKRFNFILNPGIIVDGFLAHEVQSVVPEAISGTKDEVDSDNNPVYQGIDQSKLVPLLVAAVKELTARVETLEAA